MTLQQDSMGWAVRHDYIQIIRDGVCGDLCDAVCGLHLRWVEAVFLWGVGECRIVEGGGVG